jgi:hypothetical protein
MGREGPMDRLHAHLGNHHCFRRRYHGIVLQSAYFLGIVTRFANNSLREICIRPVVRGVSARR